MRKYKCLLVFFLFVIISKLTFAVWTAPTLSSPADQTNAWAAVTLDWNAVSGSQYYQLQVDTSSGFNSPVFFTVTKAYINTNSSNTDTEQYLDNLFFGKKYYWRVRAFITGDSSTWTQRSFTTRNYVTMSSPATGSNYWAGITLNWLPHAGVDFYDIQLDTSIQFNSPVLRSVSKTYINSTDGNTDTEHYFDDLFFGKTYYWRVRARNAVDTTIWTTYWTFTTRDYITMSSPATGSNYWAGITLNWLPHAGVDFYDVQVDTSSQFNSPVKRTVSKAYVNSTDGNSDTEQFFDDLFFGKTYYWRVRARNAVDTTVWASYWTFSTRDYITMSSPATGSNYWAGITLNWLPHAGVDFYDVQVDTSSQFNSPVKRTVSKAYVNSTDGNSDTEQFFDDLFFGKTYYWRVRARNAVDTTVWASYWTFSTRDYITMSSPATGSNYWAGITLNWLPHAGVDFYDVQVDTSSQFNSPVKRTVSKAYVNSTDGNSDTEQFFDDLFFGKTYYWRVRARNAVDTTVWASYWTFTTRNYVSLLSPADGQLNVNTAGVGLDWSPHSGVDVYQLQMDTSSQFNSPLLTSVNKNYINSTDGNSDTYNASGVLLTNRTYYWRVRAINLVDTTLWSLRVFTTGNCIIPIQPQTIYGNISVCAGSTNTYNTNSVGGATSYSWSLPSGWSGNSTTNTINVIAGTTSGQVVVVANSACGSSPSQMIAVITNSVNTSVIQSGLTLTADAAGAAYQWINCNGNTPILNQTGQSFTAVSNGNYAVIVTQNNCSDTSACINILTVGIDEINFKPAIQIFPNPSNGRFVVKLQEPAAINSKIEIFNSIGEKVYNASVDANEIELCIDLPVGFYICKYNFQGRNMAVGKLIIQK
jgi:hypothetical protein